MKPIDDVPSSSANRAGPASEDPGEEDGAEDEVGVRQALDAAVETQVHAGPEQGDAGAGDDPGQAEGLVDVEEPGRHRPEHRGGEAERRAGAADEGDDEEEVDGAPEGPVGEAAAEEAHQGAGEPQARQVVAVVGPGDGDGRQGVQAPRRGAPVEDAVGRGPLARRHAAGLDAERRLVDVERPLDGAPVHQPAADAGAEQHRHPARVAVLRLRGAAEDARSVAAEREPGEEPHGEQGRPLVDQAQLAGHPLVDGGHDGAGRPRRHQDRDADAEQAEQGEAEHRPIDGRGSRWLAGLRLVGNDASRNVTLRCSVSGRLRGMVPGSPWFDPGVYRERR